MMVLNHGQYYSVSLCEKKASIQLDVILEKKARSYATSCQLLIDFFQNMLKQTCEVFMPALAKPIAYTPCPYCDELHIKYNDLREDCPQLCNMKSIPPDYYQDLFKGNEGILILNCKCIILSCFYVLIADISTTEQLEGKVILQACMYYIIIYVNIQHLCVQRTCIHLHSHTPQSHTYIQVYTVDTSITYRSLPEDS